MASRPFWESVLSRVLIVLMLALIAGCNSQPYMGDQPQIGPATPATDVTIEMEGPDTVCVTENDVRTCVPRVDQDVVEESS